MTDHTPEAVPLRSRSLLHMELGDDGEAWIDVDHIYMPEGAAGPCDHCGRSAHDPGAVGLIVSDESAVLTAEQALVLANRLQRAASLILESDESPPDIEREAARFAADAAEGEQ